MSFSLITKVIKAIRLQCSFAAVITQGWPSTAHLSIALCKDFHWVDYPKARWSK